MGSIFKHAVALPVLGSVSWRAGIIQPVGAKEGDLDAVSAAIGTGSADIANGSAHLPARRAEAASVCRL